MIKSPAFQNALIPCQQKKKNTDQAVAIFLLKQHWYPL